MSSSTAAGCVWQVVIFYCLSNPPSARPKVSRLDYSTRRTSMSTPDGLLSLPSDSNQVCTLLPSPAQRDTACHSVLARHSLRVLHISSLISDTGLLLQGASRGLSSEPRSPRKPQTSPPTADMHPELRRMSLSKHPYCS